MRIEKINIARLNPAKYNPRKDLQPEDNEYQKLKNSIDTFGLIEPIVWNENTGNVVGGHQRLKILIENGITEIDCVIVGLDDLNEKALNIALNKISGEWDDEKLRLLFKELENDCANLELTGFEDYEIERILTDINYETIIDSFFKDNDSERQNKPKICPHCGGEL